MRYPQHIRLPLAIAVGAVIAASSAVADDAVLKPVMTTATRTETLAETAPGSVSIVTRDDIDKAPRAGVKGLVSNLEGVVTHQLRGVSDLSPEITMRGLPNQARTLLLIDGIPMNTSYSGQAQLLGGVDVEDLKQVEVVRGPFSSLYGSAAMGGVVNFITALPDTSEYKATFGHGDAFEKGRAQQLFKGHLSAAEKFNDVFKAKISYGWTDSNGYKSDFVTTTTAPAGVTGYYQTPTSTGGTQYVAGNRGNGTHDRNDLNVKLELKPGAGDTLALTYIKSEVFNQYLDPESYMRNGAGAVVFNAGTNPRQSAFLTNINNYHNSLWAIDWQHRLADSRLTIKLSNLEIDEWYSTAARATTLAGGAGTLTPRFARNTLLDVLWEKPVGDSILLLGTQMKRTESVADTFNMTDWKNPVSKTNKTTSSGGKENVISLFGNFQTNLGEKLALTAGGRFEHWKGLDGYTADYTAPANTTLNRVYDPQTKSNFSPKLSANYQIASGTRVKASWGRAFRAPDALVLYRNYGTATQFISNPNLKPESSESLDVGIEQETPGRGLFKAYGYYTTMTDLISTKDLNPAGTIKERINVGKAQSKGVELSYVQPFMNRFKFSANYTLSNTKVLENQFDPTSVGKQLTQVPKHMANLGVTYDDSVYYASLSQQYSSKRYFLSNNSDTTSGVLGSFDPYTLVNAKVGWRATKQWDISLAISNLFDKEFYNSIKTEGRAWYAQASFKY